MEQPVTPRPKPTGIPIEWGAEDQAAAYRAILEKALSTPATEPEGAWEQAMRNMQETRRELGQRLIFPE
jgi:hypothetical protein